MEPTVYEEREQMEQREENSNAVRVFSGISNTSSMRSTCSTPPPPLEDLENKPCSIRSLHASQSNPQLISLQPAIETTHEPQADKNEMIDRMTLELLMNKNHFQRYISKNDPSRFAKIEEYHQNLDTYRERIIEMTRDLLNNPQKQITTDVDESFQQYTKTLIKYFEMRKLEKDSKHIQYDDDDDMLFSHMDDHRQPEQPMKSFWGKDTVLKKSAVASYDRDMFSRKR